MGDTYLLLPQFEQSDALRLVVADFLVVLTEPQFLQFDCFILSPPTPIFCEGERGIYGIAIYSKQAMRLAFTHNINMKKKDPRKVINPMNEMIQGNKDEADSMLSLWGKKDREHIKPRRHK